MVATTVYETENCGGDNITPGEDVSRTTLTSGWGCRCEANTNVPGAPCILDPPLAAPLLMFSQLIPPFFNLIKIYNSVTSFRRT